MCVYNCRPPAVWALLTWTLWLALQHCMRASPCCCSHLLQLSWRRPSTTAWSRGLAKSLLKRGIRSNLDCPRSLFLCVHHCKSEYLCCWNAAQVSRCSDLAKASRFSALFYPVMFYLEVLCWLCWNVQPNDYSPFQSCLKLESELWSSQLFYVIWIARYSGIIWQQFFTKHAWPWMKIHHWFKWNLSWNQIAFTIWQSKHLENLLNKVVSSLLIMIY